MLYKMFQNYIFASDLFRIMPIPWEQLVLSFGMIYSAFLHIFHIMFDCLQWTCWNIYLIFFCSS